MFRLIIACAIVAVATSAPAGPPAPYHAPAPAYGKAPAYDESPKPYAFEYGVADDYSGSNFKAAETSDAKVTSGSYSVNLPDGRTQIVTYAVNDAYGGYVADVKYEGVAQYPEYKPAPYHPAKPAPYHA